MEIITKTIRYWLLKKAKPDDIHDNYYYIRTKTDGVTGYQWGIGYKNRHGLVSIVGGELTDKETAELEAEFQLEIHKRDYCEDIGDRDYGDLMTAEDWEKAVDDGCFVTTDGCGYWVKDGKQSHDEVFNSAREDATHVMWYNK